MEDFVHLHVHTYYSILDGMSPIPKLVSKAVNNGMRGMAITDHGNMFGVKELFDCCAKKAGCESAECVFVGDDPKSDVLGALRAGMHPVRFCPTPPADDSLPDVPRISRLTELPALLPTLGREGVGIP